VEEFGAFASLVAGNIKAGAVESKEIAAETFSSFQATIDNLLITNGLVSPIVKTETISPLADKSDVNVQIGNPEIDQGYGELNIQNSAGEEVASINTEGDADFEGSLDVAEDTTISGTLYANKIESTTLDDIQKLLTEVEADQALLKETANWNVDTATDSANLDEVALASLYVTETAVVNSLSVSSSITIGSDLVIQSKLNDQNLAINSIDTLSTPLSIQSLALAPVEIMAGKVKIETNGDVSIQGNLFVAGQIQSQGLTLGQVDTEPGATISASGSAEFNSVAAEKLIIAASEVATPSAGINGEIETNATAGNALLPAGTEEITIKNPNISDYTLVYVTPTSSTLNNVLYIKAKGAGFFTVGFSQALDTDVTFNWWVIDVHE
jgi:hypothetical protein